MGDRHTIHAVLDAIERGQRFLVSAHARPDGDAVGSMLACGMILEQLGKQVEMVSCDRVPLIYRSLPCASVVRQVSRVEGEYDAVILLECDGIERSRLRGLDGRFLINIDHHVSGRTFGNINWIDTEACAVAEMVYKLAMVAGVCITPEMATCLYTAVLTDTGSFCYDGTDAHTFELAAELVRHGAKSATIAKDVYFSHPTSKMLLLGAALSNLRREGRIAWMWVTHDDMVRTSAAEEDCEGIVNYAIAIAGVDVAIFLRELSNHRVRLSLRSKGDVNVARLAERFGGGGHQHASGCTIDGPLPDATDMILEVARRTLSAAVHESHSLI
ncbi:bifunctional oligoribonuclease/PAP phosphatase NrnA [Alloacidobacterium dinghuense]|uniref:Bifunctional oligoribonuclease/PAP phosphatase NrnA n=1 Tax=Alloacidobacterium dinghuense TaxID=2763107 RepID=A0A7G8BDE5_9BACT|nr:bifunctional oligoribonuclease/PAP phosphatase NrnA [Alloacidobacterium dinghuense]QNI30565.1 bifunctional oligoribonuclease/PAP phosphatase NrnA [Alloacidobacterium dinghuense]